MKILLEPTGQIEAFAGRQFRVYRGTAEGGIPLQMIGMFRLAKEEDKMRFVAGIPPQSGPVTPIIGAERLLTGVDERPTMADALREGIHKLRTDCNARPVRDDAEALVRATMDDAYQIVLRMIEDLRGRTR